MLSALALAFVTTAAPSAPGETLLEICRSAYESFEPKAAVKSCGAAADVNELTVTQRIQALRYLAQSHILANEDADAARAFTRMLVLDDALLLTRDAGPRERDVFARARATVDQKGRISATHALDDDGRLRVDVKDPLARVAGARVRVSAADRISVAPLAGSRGDGVLVLNGVLPPLAGAAHVTYEVLLDGHTGTPLAVDAPLRGTRGIAGADGHDGAIAVQEEKRSERSKPFDGIGYGVIATGIGLEACWLLAAVPVATSPVDPEAWLPTALVGAVTFATLIAAGTGIVLWGPEAQ
jgi:hypothetical protein